MKRRDSLPLLTARCIPERPCPQADRCARRQARADDFRDEIDASHCLSPTGCALFVDVRALALLPQTAIPATTAPATGVTLPKRAATWLTSLGVAA
jgi:hypothetical protein